MIKRNIKLRLSIFTAAALVACYFGWQHFQPIRAEYTPVESTQLSDGTNVKFRTQGEKIEVYSNQKWQPFFAKGVNLGATTPGYDPGELAIDKPTFLRWFAEIKKLGSNVIRVYTIHNPVFYDSLVEYNHQHPEDPLYFIQGVWSPEEQFYKTYDALSAISIKAFKTEISHAVGAVYGDISIPAEQGKASGSYKTNAAPYLLGWSIGTEWDPTLVDRTNKAHPGLAPFKGDYFQAKSSASPFESMLAEMLNTLASFESRYGWQHPYTFTNWVTTDPLSHPGEILVDEDLVSVDAMHIEPVNWKAGYFASFHAYPYYPDFFRLDETLKTVRNDKGELDSYKSYLRLLKEHHKGIPIMITEFGVPSSKGVAHLTDLGRNQGGHTEQEQGIIDADLLHQINQEQYAGAILFMWQDEWFKRTWNTQDYEQPVERRKYWLNVLTNEKLFGLDGFYSSKDGPLKIDGNLDDWSSIKDKKEFVSSVPGWKKMMVTHDEAYLYVAIELEQNFDPSKMTLHIGTDTLEGGNRHSKEMGNRILNQGLETLISIGNEQDSAISIASNYDFTARLWGKIKGMFPVNPAEMKNDSGVFAPWKLPIDLKMAPPAAKKSNPYQDVLVGQLPRGTTNAADPNYNSLAMWEAKGKTVEIRIPWMLLGFSDPSSLRVVNYEEADGKLLTSKIDGIRLVPWIMDNSTKEVQGLGDGSTEVDISQMPKYKWRPWNEVHFQERLKQSYPIMQKAFSEIK
ncbi:hypothetical protein [Paenibacillus sp. GP183]|uniref:hypothetical protein n=1 Tax=Paenibacillus sp. GP183 TaxID=1882751 RepID=UPI000899F055|nr:hypothetical protein [Paenibacillus sp. GP183]SEB91034.1 hypothetical protein SAMN05443246_2325 [Paenibacillus sp. GP183]